MKLAFTLDTADASQRPQAAEICTRVAQYAAETGEAFTFVSRTKPVTFYLGKRLYEVEIRTMRGGYYLCCKEK